MKVAAFCTLTFPFSSFIHSFIKAFIHSSLHPILQCHTPLSACWWWKAKRTLRFACPMKVAAFRALTFLSSSTTCIRRRLSRSEGNNWQDLHRWWGTNLFSCFVMSCIELCLVSKSLRFLHRWWGTNVFLCLVMSCIKLCLVSKNLRILHRWWGTT